MKKVYFLILALCLPIIINAGGVSFSELHEMVSETNEITIPTISLDYFSDHELCEQCTGDCDCTTSEIIPILVKAYVIKNVDFVDGLELSVSCETENLCSIEFRNEYNDSLSEDYTITYSTAEYNETIFNDVNSKLSLFDANKYNIIDMGYINEVIHYENLYDLWKSIMFQDKTVLSMFPELKMFFEKNNEYDYVVVGGMAGAPGDILSNSVALVGYKDGVVYGISSYSPLYTYPMVFIPNTVEDSEETYVEVALDRIKKYINDEDVQVSIVKNTSYDLSGTDIVEIVGQVANHSDLNIESLDIIPAAFTLSVDSNNYHLYLAKVDESEIKELEVSAYNKNSGILVSSKDSSLPLDFNVLTLDITDRLQFKDLLKAYDITLFSSIKNDYISMIDGGVKVRIPVGNDVNIKNLVVYNLDEDGTKKEIYKVYAETINGQKYAVFTTKHFSSYGIFLEENNPKTNDNIIFYLISFIISFIGLYIFRKKIVDKI